MLPTFFFLLAILRLFAKVVIPPVADHTEKFWSEWQGMLDDDLTYKHGPDKSEMGISLLEFTRVAGEGVLAVNTPVSSEEMRTGRSSSSVVSDAVEDESKGGNPKDASSDGQAPNRYGTDAKDMVGTKSGGRARPPTLARALRRPEWLDVLVERVRAFPPSSTLLVNRVDTVYRLLRGDRDARASLASVFASDLRGGAHNAFAEPAQFAAAATPPLLAWYYRESGDAFRDATFPPSAFLLEAVARRWDDVTSSPEKSFELFSRTAQGAAGGGGSKVTIKEPTAAQPLNESPAVKLALLDSESWIMLVGEALALGLLVEDKVRHHLASGDGHGD